MTTKAAIALCVKQGLASFPAPTTKSAEAIKATLRRREKLKIRPVADRRYIHVISK